MMRKRLLILVTSLLALSAADAQKAIVEESVVDVECLSPTHVIQHFREVTTVLNEQGADLATFVCSCSKNDKLTDFKGVVSDGTGRVIRKLKESELQKTEYSHYLAIDDYKMYLEYTPPVYPLTISYEWTIESRDNLVEFPRFCPQADYDISVKKASYQLKVPKSMNVRYASQHIDKQPTITDLSATTQLFTLEVGDMPIMKQEAYGRPLRERMPIAWFAPTDFIYYGTRGSLRSWKDYGLWEYSLIQGQDVLPEAVRRELHQLTDTMKTDREKVEALYKRLEKTTRYVAVLLGIGGQKPASASTVCKSGYGDCKGLSNYMRAMLKEVGIASNYTTISTNNRRFLRDFANVGQMNHVILQVPLANDTLWLECTNPQLPLGYVHDDIAGHDAIEISEQGGRLVRLPVYADSTNLMRTTIAIAINADGAAEMSVSQQTFNEQYEDHIPLLTMDDKELQRVFLHMVHVPQAEVSELKASQTPSAAQMTLDAKVRSNKYATQTGQRLFVPVCPVHQGYTVPKSKDERQEDIWINHGYLDEDDITLTIPEGYVVEARPKNVSIEHPFATFSFTLQVDGNTIHAKNRLLKRSGTFDKSLFPQLFEFFRTISNTYNQKIVLKKVS